VIWKLKIPTVCVFTHHPHTSSTDLATSCLPLQPDGHAFILRRMDTGAVNVESMLRAAFLYFHEDFERIETSWIAANFDVLNGDYVRIDGTWVPRLDGTWVSTEVALWLASGYHLEKILPLFTRRFSSNDLDRLRLYCLSTMSLLLLIQVGMLLRNTL
jgi:hypothetical protein